MKKSFDKNSSMALKGIAILMMLFHHNFLSVDRYKGFEVSFAPFSEVLIVNIASSFKICVSLFAFISGFGLYLNYKKTKLSDTRWVLSRDIKLLSGFWLAWLFSCVVCQVLNGRTQTIYFSDGLWNGLLNMILDEFGLASLFGMKILNGSWWYMGAALVFVLLIPVVTKLENHLWLLLAGLIFLPRLLRIDVVSGTAPFVFLSPFLLGVISARYGLVDRWVNWGNGRITKFIKFLLELVAVFLGYKFYIHVERDVFWELQYGLFAFVVILLCIEFIVYLPGIRWLLMFLGKHSMNIFYLHTLVRLYYLRDFIYSFHHFVLITLVLLIISLILSFIMEGIKRVIEHLGGTVK